MTTPATDTVRSLRRIGKTIEKKIDRLPEGRYAVLVSCMTVRGRSRAARRTWQVVAGHPDLSEALQASLGHIELALHAANTVPPPEEFLCMPGNAEKRARRVRNLLVRAWKDHVRGTPHASRKQMYATVRQHPDMLFGWWEHVTGGAPFENTAVDDSGVSEAVFRYLAPVVYARMRDSD